MISMPLNLRSIFSPQVIYEVQSQFCGPIQVVRTGNSVYVSTGGLTQSGGLVKNVWESVFKKISKTYNLTSKSWLILGLGAGTAAQMISGRFQPKKITGVEIDPVMIYIGKRYFDLDKIMNLKIIINDAKDYLLTTRDQYDVILVDLYLGDRLPGFVYSEKFLKKLRQLGLPSQHRSMSRDRIDPKGEWQDGEGQLVILNHLFYDPPKRQAASQLVAKLGKIFPSVRLHRVLTNLLIICS